MNNLLNLKRHMLWIFMMAIIFTIISSIPANAETTGNWKDYATTSFSEGSGTADEPYQISSAEELAYLTKQVNEGTDTTDKYYELTADIDLSGHYWAPIGIDYNKTFKGHFDGKGHEINNVYIGTESSPNDSYKYVGLFGYSKGTIENIGVSVSIYSSKESGYVGGLIGYNKNGPINNSYATGNVIGGDEAKVGGLLGYNYGYSGTINNSYATGDVTGGNSGNAYPVYVGGLVGYNYYGKINNSYATGDVTGGDDAKVGGLLGYDLYGTVKNGYYNASAKQEVANSPQESKGVGYGTDNAKGKTSTYMQSQEFVSILNTNLQDGWKPWTIIEGKNDGYPKFVPLAEELPVNVLPGTVLGSIKVEITKDATSKFVVNITESPVTVPSIVEEGPASGDNLVDSYISENNIITGVEEGKYLQVYDIDTKGKVAGFYQKQLETTDILQLDRDGEITTAIGVTEPVAISTTINSEEQAIDIFDFTITDKGTSDNSPLKISEIKLSVSGTMGDTQRSQLTYRLNGNDESNVIGTYDADTDTISFKGLNISIAHGESEVYTINAYYNDNTNLTDGKTIILSIDGDTDVTVSKIGTQMRTTSPVTNETGSTIDVKATKLEFSTQPSDSVSGVSMIQPIVRTTDEAGNIDTDFNKAITLTENSEGALSGDIDVIASNGIATFTDIVYIATNDGENFALTARSEGLTSVTSDAISSDVQATKLILKAEPLPAIVNNGKATSFTTVPIVQAVDKHNLVDTDYTKNITLSKINGAGSATLSCTGDKDDKSDTVTLTPTSGVAEFKGLQIKYMLVEDRNEIFNLQVASTGLTSGESHEMTASANTASIVTNINKNGAEDNIVTFTEADFTNHYNDVDGDALTKIQITTLPANGILKKNSTPINKNDEIILAELSSIIFEPDANWNGSTSFTWKGYDGIEYSSNIAKVSITINFVDNIAPTKPRIIRNPDKDMHNDDYTIELISGTDGDSGVKETVSRTVYGEVYSSWETYTKPFTITREGTTKIQAKTIDNTGNESKIATETITINKDIDISLTIKTDPDTKYSYEDYTVTLVTDHKDKTVEDSVYSNVKYKLNDGDFKVYKEPFTITQKGETKIVAKVIDEFGNSLIEEKTVYIYEDKDDDDDDDDKSNNKSSRSRNKTKNEKGIDVIVNGEKQTAGKETVEKEKGKTIVKLEVESKAVDKKIDEVLKEKENLTKEEQEKAENIVEIPVAQKDYDKVKTSLTGDIVKKMDENKFNLAVETKGIDYIIPAKEIGIEKVAKVLEVDKRDLEEIEVEININKTYEKIARQIEKNAKENKYEVVFPPVDFEVVAKTKSTKGEKREVKRCLSSKLS